jgi:hypothetical protein
MSAEPTTQPADRFLVLDGRVVVEQGMHESSLPAGPLRPRPGVLAAYALDAMALYDPRSERYLTLNPVATQIWEALAAGQLPAVIAERIAAEYTVPAAQVRADMAAQLASWHAEGLVEPGVAGPPPSAVTPRRGEYDVCIEPDRQASVPVRRQGRAVPVVVRIPSVLRCLSTTVRIKWLLQRRRFEGTLAWLRAAVGGVPASEGAELEEVRALEYRVAMAGAFYPGRARCLEQSLTLYLLARRQQIAVRYCQGMQLYPFEAHAWIEYRGEVINDVAEHVKHFTKFPEQLP